MSSISVLRIVTLLYQTRLMVRSITDSGRTHINEGNADGRLERILLKFLESCRTGGELGGHLKLGEQRKEETPRGLWNVYSYTYYV